MAVDNYNPIVLQGGECLDQDWFEPTYQSLAALEQAAKDGAADVSCVHFFGTISGNTISGESCTIAIPSSDMPKVSVNSNQICCLFLGFYGSMGSYGQQTATVLTGDALNYAYYSAQDLTVAIKCGGQTISTQSGRGSGIMPVILNSSICDFSQGIEICTTSTTSYAAHVFDYGFNWCGCMLCVQCPPLQLENYYIPRTAPSPNCEYGLADLSLVIHTLNQMNAAFRGAGYTVECITRQGLTESTEIVSELDADAKFMAMSCTTAEWSSIPIGTLVTVDSNMGCAERPVSCNSGYYYSRGIGNGGGLSAEFSNLACGECKKGESIWFGATPQYTCALPEPDEPLPPALLIVGGESDVVFWIFRKIENDLPNLPQINNGCVFEDTADAITDGADAIHEAACSVRKINKQSRPFSGAALNGENYQIVAPYIDPNPPVPPVPPPIKKWAIIGSFHAFAQATGAPSNVSLGGNFSYQIKCGGAVVHQSPIYRWLTVFEGIDIILSERLPVCAFIDCPVDQPIDICVNSTLGGLGATFGGAFNGTALCISQ